MRDRDARIAGLIYVLAIIIGFAALEYLPGKFITPGNAVATAHEIAAHPFLFRVLIAGDVIMGAVWLAVVIALYRLLVNVSRDWASMMLILGAYMQVPLYFVNVLNYAAALLLVTDTGYLTTIPVVQRDALAMLFLRMHHYELLGSFIFAGLWLLPFGGLVYKSGFLPRTLGVWLVLDCFAWLAICFTGFLAPQYSDAVSNATFPLTTAEIAIALWLVIFGARTLGKRSDAAPSPSAAQA